MFEQGQIRKGQGGGARGERLDTQKCGFSAAAQVVLLNAYEYWLSKKKENVVNWEMFLGYIDRENLWPIVASDSGCELRPVHKEENKDNNRA